MSNENTSGSSRSLFGHKPSGVSKTWGEAHTELNIKTNTSIGPEDASFADKTNALRERTEKVFKELIDNFRKVEAATGRTPEQMQAIEDAAQQLQALQQGERSTEEKSFNLGNSSN